MNDAVNAMAAHVDSAIARMVAALPSGANICVAYSGGEDSTVLLHALATHREQISLSAQHVHHGLSANADAWAAHCNATCAALGVALTLSHVKVDGSRKQGIEAAARDARYAALRAHAAAHGHLIALAHHQRDQAETLLLQLLRGAGPEGLAAMPASDALLLRPLLAVGKAAISLYAITHALKSVNDESNADRRFARNRLRIDVWPVLINAFASAEHTLARGAALQAEAATLMHELALIDAETCINNNSALNLAAWRRLNSSRRRNVLRYWLETLAVRALSFAELAEWEKQLASESPEQNVTLRVPASDVNPHSHVRVYRGFAHRVRDLHVVQNPLPWGGESRLRFGDGNVTFASVNAINAHAGAAKKGSLRLPRDGEQWLLRTRREGDAIMLSPRSGHVALKNIMQNANVPPWDRAHWPILVCNQKIAAVPGLCIAAEFVASPAESGVFPEWSARTITANSL
jgi:tRNA(Ile)-lysidine synthase